MGYVTYIHLPAIADAASSSHTGDSLHKSNGSLKGRKSSDTLLQDTRTGILHWLDKSGFKLTDIGNVLAIGEQVDTNSCGICVLNAIEHAIFGHSLFQYATRHEHRLRYFLAAFQYSANKVGGHIPRDPFPCLMNVYL